MAYIRCVGGSGGSIQKKTATGAVAAFNTSLPAPLIDVTSAIGYRSNGYTSASVINSKTTPVIDETPYHTRINSNIGNMALEKLVGVSCVFNQLQANTLSRTNNGVTYTFNNGELSVVTDEGGATATSWWLTGSDTKWEWIANHVYLVIVGNPNYTYSGGAYPNWYIPTSPQTTLLKNENIFKPTANATTYMQFTISTGNELNTKYKPQVFDLTAMFGSEVADYLYTLESGTAGSGVALFKSLFGADYYPYTANTLMSAKPTGKKIVGKNFFNGEYEELYELPFVLKKGTVVTASCVQTTEDVSYIYYYDKDGNLIDYWGMSTVISGNHKYRTFTIDNDCYYMRHYIAPANDVQVEIGSTPTAYEPYSETTIVYSGNELRGLLKVVDGKLVADGDTDDGSGTETVRYGIVDLGSLNWGYENGVFQAYYEAFKGSQADNLIGNYLCPDYLASNAWTVFGGSADKVFYISNDHYIRIVDNDYSDSATFKTANSGVYMLCELATPTTQTISAWSNPIVAKDGGTETFVDGNEFSIVDLGSLEWTKGGTQFNTNSLASLIKIPSSIQTPVLIADNMIPKSSNDVSGITGTYEAYIDANGYLYWFYPLDDFADGNEFKTAMQGHYLIYENTNSVGFQMFTGHSTIYGTDLSVKKAEFGTTVYGGSIDFTTGEVISNKNADGTDKTAETISITPVEVLSNAGTNNVFSDTNGNTTAQYIDKR